MSYLIRNNSEFVRSIHICIQIRDIKRGSCKQGYRHIFNYHIYTWGQLRATVLHHLTHWGRVTHICVSKLTIIGSDNGLSPGRRQAIIWTNTGILLIGPLGTNFSEILIEILIFSFKKMRLKVSSAKRRPFCLGLNVLTYTYMYMCYIQLCIPFSPEQKHLKW